MNKMKIDLNINLNDLDPLERLQAAREPEMFAELLALRKENKELREFKKRWEKLALRKENKELKEFKKRWEKKAAEWEEAASWGGGA